MATINPIGWEQPSNIYGMTELGQLGGSSAANPAGNPTGVSSPSPASELASLAAAMLADVSRMFQGQLGQTSRNEAMTALLLALLVLLLLQANERAPMAAAQSAPGSGSSFSFSSTSISVSMQQTTVLYAAGGLSETSTGTTGGQIDAVA